MVVNYPLEIKHGWKIHEKSRTKWKFIAGKIIEENASDELTTLGMKKLKKYENIAEWLYHPSCPWKWTLCVACKFWRRSSTGSQYKQHFWTQLQEDLPDWTVFWRSFKICLFRKRLNFVYCDFSMAAFRLEDGSIYIHKWHFFIWHVSGWLTLGTCCWSFGNKGLTLLKIGTIKTDSYAPIFLIR